MNCEQHKKPILGICIEEVCKYPCRNLCQDCQFNHTKCRRRIKTDKFNKELQYILNPDLHRATCAYFVNNSKLYNYLAESMDKLKQDVLQSYMNVELKHLQVLLSEQGDLRWSQILLNMKNNKLSKQEYDAATTLYREKQVFDEDAMKLIQKYTTDQTTTLNHDIAELTRNYKLMTIQYDPREIYLKAQTTIEKSNQPFQDISEHIKLKHFKLLKGHTENSSIRCILNTDQYIISGSDDGKVIGWLKPHLYLDYRIQCNQGLSAMCTVKVQDQHYLFVASQATIQSYSMQTKQKLFQLTGHKQQITKLIGYQYKYLISSSWDGTIKVWDLLNRNIIKSYHDHVGPITDMCLDRDLITVGQDGSISFIDINSQTIKGHINIQIPIYSIAQIKPNKYILGLGNGHLKILKDKKISDIPICEDVIWKVLKLNTKTVACLSQDGFINIVNLKRLNKVNRYPIANDCLWQDMIVSDNKLLLPQQGRIQIYE